MSGILVGVDGSGHSQRALEWAAKEAAIRQASLTVLAVDQAVAGFWGGTLHYGEDETRTQKVREAAQAETDKVLAALGDSRPASVTVTAGVAGVMVKVRGLLSPLGKLGSLLVKEAITV